MEELDGGRAAQLPRARHNGKRRHDTTRWRVRAQSHRCVLRGGDVRRGGVRAKVIDIVVVSFP
jgi:hypothetical protein